MSGHRQLSVHPAVALHPHIYEDEAKPGFASLDFGSPSASRPGLPVIVIDTPPRPDPTSDDLTTGDPENCQTLTGLSVSVRENDQTTWLARAGVGFTFWPHQATRAEIRDYEKPEEIFPFPRRYSMETNGSAYPKKDHTEFLLVVLTVVLLPRDPINLPVTFVTVPHGARPTVRPPHRSTG
ncbi:unnamed protein product [Heligmosomoides polygyrus]|uniref:Uncharacterized protein n=1 Tax=Heligmosomoides polygyrus TaxID=6339 RepID=A0A183G6I8_HELPZ|nr:unnamed protein product [Heligmosomoides polygyrus]